MTLTVATESEEENIYRIKLNKIHMYVTIINDNTILVQLANTAGKIYGPAYILTVA
jgi:hypothetical protein